MLSIRSNITFDSLLKVAYETSHWEGNCEDISLHYLHHNGKVFSLVGIEDDNDIKCMLILSAGVTNEIYLYIKKRLVGSGLGIGHQPRPHSLKRLMRDEKFMRTDGNHDAKRKAPAFRDTSIPTVNLSEDYDMKFSSKPNNPKDELAQESDIVFHTYIDAVESDDEVEGINIEAESPSSRTHGGACLRRALNAKCNVELPPTHKCEVIFEDSMEPIQVDQPINNTHVGVGDRVIVDVKSNVGEPSTHRREVIFEDNMVPDELSTDTYHTTSREMWIGREFPDQENFRRILAKFAIDNNFELLHLKTSKFKATAHCKDQNCLWRIHASIIESGPKFKVRTYNPLHTCSKPMMGMAHRQASSKLIVKYILDTVRLNNNLKPKEIMNDYQMEFGVTISYRKAHIARKMALRIVRGSYESSFKILPLYCAELKMMNPGSVTNIQTSDDDRFKRFFWTFASSIRAFTSSLKPMIAADGTHLCGKYPGVLLVAVTFDAYQQLFPIAYAFAETERRDSWEWFFANVSLLLGEPTSLNIIPDRQKGLVPAVAKVMPIAAHCYCCRHLAENIKTKFNDSAIVMKFWCAAKAHRVCEHEAFMDEIKAVNMEAYNYIHQFGRQHWANAFVHGRRYDMLTNNAAECTNNMLKDTRVLPIVKQVEEISVKLMEFFQKRQAGSLAVNTRLTPYAEKQLSHETEEARELHVRVARLEEFQVQSASYVDVVHLDRRTCTCRKWQIIGIPCAHAIAGMRLRSRNPYDFCDDFYLASKYQSTYKEEINATRDSKRWEYVSDEIVLPPLYSKQPGRPKKNRICTEDRYRVRRVVTCSHCNERCHNRASCRNPPRVQNT